jgi:hypothetical protein
MTPSLTRKRWGTVTRAAVPPIVKTSVAAKTNAAVIIAVSPVTTRDEQRDGAAMSEGDDATLLIRQTA